MCVGASVNTCHASTSIWISHESPHIEYMDVGCNFDLVIHTGVDTLRHMHAHHCELVHTCTHHYYMYLPARGCVCSHNQSIATPSRHRIRLYTC